MAKIVHSGDWHIDKSSGRIARAGDHEAVLAEIVSLVAEQKPDLFINAGDLFQGVRPTTEGMRLAFQVLQEIAAICPVVVIRGNHDSEPLFEFFAQILGEDSRIKMVAKVQSPSEGGILEFGALGGKQRIRLAALPFVHANRVVGERVFGPPEEWMEAYAEQMGKYTRMLSMGLRMGRDAKRDVDLFAAHMHVAGAQWSGSERAVHVSEAYALKPESIPPVAYAALGHIHKPQALPGGVSGRFAGSPLQMDFGEEGENKGIVVIEANPGEAARIEVLGLHRGRHLRRIEGTPEEVALMARSVSDEIVRVTVQTEVHQINLSEWVADLMPQASIQEILEDCAQSRLTILDETDAVAGEEKPLGELFAEFLQLEGTKGAQANLVLESFKALLEGVEGEHRVEFPEHKALAEEGHE